MSCNNLVNLFNKFVTTLFLILGRVVWGLVWLVIKNQTSQK